MRCRGRNGVTHDPGPTLKQKADPATNVFLFRTSRTGLADAALPRSPVKRWASGSSGVTVPQHHRQPQIIRGSGASGLSVYRRLPPNALISVDERPPVHTAS